MHCVGAQVKYLEGCWSWSKSRSSASKIALSAKSSPSRSGPVTSTDAEKERLQKFSNRMQHRFTLPAAGRGVASSANSSAKVRLGAMVHGSLSAQYLGCTTVAGNTAELSTAPTGKCFDLLCRELCCGCSNGCAMCART